MPDPVPFTVEEVQEMVKALNDAGVPYIEVSHSSGLGGSSFQYGFSQINEMKLIGAAASVDVAINELNQYTEFKVWYVEQKKGRAIVGFDLHWSTGEKVASATRKQINELKTILNAIHEGMFDFINLRDDKNRQTAIELVRQAERMTIYTEDPICITKERADRLIMDANWILRELERLHEIDTNTKVLFYNWLDGN